MPIVVNWLEYSLRLKYPLTFALLDSWTVFV